MGAKDRPKNIWRAGFITALAIGTAGAQAQPASLVTLSFSGPTPPNQNFSQASGFSAPLVVGSAGNLYGVDVDTVIFGISPQGALAPIYSFFPQYLPGSISPLTLGSDGNLYGTTSVDEATGTVTAFRVSPEGVLTTLYSLNVLFPPTDSTCNVQFGSSALVQGGDGNLYGVGIRGENGGVCTGSVFKITLGGALTLLHAFGGADGVDPRAALIQASDGNFYGSTSAGGGNNLGTIFQISAAGVFTTLHSFAGADGATPMAALVQGKDGNLYGTTSAGGAFNAGTIFSITPKGQMTLLYSFTGEAADGGSPNGLTLGSDGNFYGTTRGGAVGCAPTSQSCQTSQTSLGTIFMTTPSGALTTLYTFGDADGQVPLANLVQGLDGNFYGTTSSGGPNRGTIFKVSTGLETVGQAVAAAPANVTYVIDADGNATVSWSAAAGATSYNVYATTQAQFQWTGGMGSLPVATTTATSLTLTGLPNGTGDFKVAWVNSSGTSGLSSLATGSGTTGTPSPPAMQTGSQANGSTTPMQGGGGALSLWMLLALCVATLSAIGRHVHNR